MHSNFSHLAAAAALLGVAVRRARAVRAVVDVVLRRGAAALVRAGARVQRTLGGGAEGEALGGRRHRPRLGEEEDRRSGADGAEIRGQSRIPHLGSVGNAVALARARALLVPDLDRVRHVSFLECSLRRFEIIMEDKLLN